MSNKEEVVVGAKSLQLKGTQDAKPSDSSSGRRKCKKTATALSPQRQDPLWQLLDSKIGGREGLLEIALASNNPKAGDLARLILDKTYRTWGTKKLAQKAGLTAPEIVDLFRDKKWLETTLVLHEELPAIVQDAATDAKASWVPCPECKGKPINWDSGEGGEQCYVCEGKGKIRRQGDKDKLSFIGEAAGLVGKKGPFVQVNTLVNNQPTANATNFEDLMKKATVTVVQKKIESVKEAEVVEHKNS